MPPEFRECPELVAHLVDPAGAKSGPEDNFPPDSKQPCPCRTCCCGKQPTVIPCYKQPKIPPSYAPSRCYLRPTAAVDGNTTYKMSYLPVEGGDLRGQAVRPISNLVASVAPMDGDTVQKLSYLPNYVCATRLIPPCNHDMWGRGPMQNITTQRHDFVPKPNVVRRSMKPPAAFPCVETPFEDKTVNRLSYIPPEMGGKLKNYAPQRCYERPVAAMDGYTTNKLSYLPNQILPKEIHPWAVRGPYQKSRQPVETGTVYRMSYLDALADCRRKAFIPSRGMNPVTPSTAFETGTVYRNSYLPATINIPASMRPVHNLVASTALMDGDTVQKLSYLPNYVCATRLIPPCHHDMWGRGPMQNITTQRHDFVPKPNVVRRSMKPPGALHGLETPFENKTINRLSFLDPGRCKVPLPYKPLRCYERPCAPMESGTTQKMSYQAVCTTAPQRPPWASKAPYQRPDAAFAGTTIYKASFLPPGEDCSIVVDPCCYGDCKTCTCSYPSECIRKNPCACPFPTAAVC